MNVTLWRQDVAISTPVRASGELHDTRSRLFLRVEHDGVAGFGEVAPQPAELNGDAAIADAIDEVRIFLAPQLRQILEREGSLPSWTRVARFAGPRAASNPAVALLEMALLDRELRWAAATIDSLWPLKFDTPVQATISLLDDVAVAIDPTVARVRVKLSSDRVDTTALRNLERLSTPVLLDYNCAASDDDGVIEQVRLIRGVCDVVAVEQPYDVGNLADTARLAERLDVPVSIDEGVRNEGDVSQIVRYKAAQIICVKPARVGGLANARSIILRAQELGLRPYVGGFFESSFARRVHRHLANSCVNEPSDLLPVEVVLDGYSREVDAVVDAFGVTPSTEMIERGAVLVDIEATIYSVCPN